MDPSMLHLKVSTDCNATNTIRCTPRFTDSSNLQLSDIGKSQKLKKSVHQGILIP